MHCFDRAPARCQPIEQRHLHVSGGRSVVREFGGTSIDPSSSSLSSFPRAVADFSASVTYWMRMHAALPAEPPDDVRSWPVWDVLRPHVRRLIDWSKDHGNPAPTSVLLNDLRLLLLAKALYAEAEPLMRRALAIFEQSYGLEHPTTVTVSRNYQALLKKMH